MSLFETLSRAENHWQNAENPMYCTCLIKTADKRSNWPWVILTSKVLVFKWTCLTRNSFRKIVVNVEIRTEQRIYNSLMKFSMIKIKNILEFTYLWRFIK